MNELVFQNVFDILEGLLPEQWKRIIFFAAIGTGTFKMSFYTDHGDGNYIECFEEKESEEAEIAVRFMKINDVLNEARRCTDENKLWDVFTMEVCSDGNMNSTFEYDMDISDPYFQKKWEESHLK